MNKNVYIKHCTNFNTRFAK